MSERFLSPKLTSCHVQKLIFYPAHRLACLLHSYVYLLQASDVPIDDDRRKKLLLHRSCPDPSLNDVAAEIDHLFYYAVSCPTRSIRQYLERPISSAPAASKADTTARGDVLKLLHIIIAPTLDALYKIGSTVLKIVLESTSATTNALQTRHRSTRFRLALLRILQYISDCHRYPYDYAPARRAAQFMRIVDPSDAEAHMRIALNLSPLLDPVDVLAPFFHFCVFLCNHPVHPVSPEASVVDRLVFSCASAPPPTSQYVHSTRARFTQTFVPVVWNLLKYDGSSPEPISIQRLDSIPVLLRKALEDGFTETDGRYLVGVFLYLLYTMRPNDSTQTKIHPAGAQSDQLVAKALDVMSDKILDGLKNATAVARSRKKSCHRSRGKKRRGKGSMPGVDKGATGIAADVLATGVNLEQSVPMLAPFSILCGYWAVQRGAPPPQLDLSHLAVLLKKLRQILSAIHELMRIAAVLPFFNHLCSRLFSVESRNNMLFPALQEDDMFRPIAAVASHEIFRGVKFHEIALSSAVKSFRGCEDVLKRCFNDDKNEELTYEQYASDLSYKHMRAFALRTSQDVSSEITNWRTDADGDALAKVVATAIRNVRITRLVRDLERVRGGTLSREAEPRASHAHAKNAGDGDGNVADHLQGSELERHVRKKQRLVGSFSPTKLQGMVAPTEATNSARVDLPASNPGQGRVVITYAAADVAEPNGVGKFGSVGEEKITAPRHSIPENINTHGRSTGGDAIKTAEDVLRDLFQEKILATKSLKKVDWTEADEYWREGFSGAQSKRLQ